MGKIFKRAGIKLSTLIIAIVVFGVMFSTVGATLLFGVFYERTMFNSAYVSSKQSVSQANGTVSNYISPSKTSWTTSATRRTAATVCSRLKKLFQLRRGLRTISIA